MRDRTDKPACVIGVGASAGGLKALQAFFSAFRRADDIAVIVVQHLSADHQSHMRDILAKWSEMTVVEAQDGIALRGGHVYTCPAGHHIEVGDGELNVVRNNFEGYQNTAIDRLFSSLAAQYNGAAIAVILSGTGSDGTNGAKLVKAAGGTVLVQSPEDAEFDGMPRSAINALQVDLVADAAQLPDYVSGLIERPDASLDAPDDETASEADEVQRIVDLIDSAEGHNFSDYKNGTLTRRIARRVGLTKSRSMAGYRALLEQDGAERQILIGDLLIAVTLFFRDAAVWDAMREKAVAPVLRNLSDGDTVRAWVAGCATGEEAYTLAIILKECIRETGRDIRVQVFASDLNARAIEVARSGRYSLAAISDIPQDVRDRSFKQIGDTYEIVPDIRQCLIFAVQNAVTDPPFSALDIITCRNLLIYLKRNAQEQLIETFHFALRDGGFLLLGTSERIDSKKVPFATVDKKNCIFQRPAGPQRRPSLAQGSRSSVPRITDNQRNVNPIRDGNLPLQAMLTRFAPPAVLLDEDFQIQGLHGEVDAFLDFRRGAFTGNLSSLIKPYLKPRLNSALGIARSKMTVQRIIVTAEDDDARPLEVIVEPLRLPDHRTQFLVYFDTMQSGGDRDNDDRRYQDEIRSLTEQLASGNTGDTIADTELQAANEEIMSANEELQSSNEELETSREELQSLNEELNTINAELKDKVGELEETNDDLSNLIASTDIATIFLDSQFCIRRYSKKALELFNARDSDIGRPFADLVMNIKDPHVHEDGAKVLETLETSVREIHGDGYAYLRRISPYRTRNQRIDGIILTYSDIQGVRLASQRLAQQAERQALIADLAEFALSTESVAHLFERAANDIARHIDAPFVEIQWLSADRSRFVMVAGTGWPAGAVGTLATENDAATHLGFALRQPGVVTIETLSDDDRFSPAQHVLDANPQTGLCTPIGPPISPSGVLCVWWAEKTEPGEDVTSFLGTVANILWLATTQLEAQKLQESSRQELQDLIDGLPVMIGILNEQSRFETANLAVEEVGFTRDEIPGMTVGEVFGKSAGQEFDKVAAEARITGVGSTEVDIEVPGRGVVTFLMNCTPRNRQSGAGGYYFAAIDIHDRKLSEERNQVISAELDHRVKNVLALVNVIARMSGRGTTDIDVFRKDFRNRVASLARTHSTLASEDWTGMNLHKLLSDELTAYASEARDNYVLDGPDVFLGMRTTQSLALAIHEMTTNAVKYGALSRQGGRLEIHWAWDGDDLTLEWRESGLSELSTPEHKGFGSQVLDTAISVQLGGEIETEFGTSGVVHRIRIPRNSIEDAR